MPIICDMYTIYYVFNILYTLCILSIKVYIIYIIIYELINL